MTLAEATTLAETAYLGAILAVPTAIPRTDYLHVDDLSAMLDDAAARIARADNAITRTTAPPPDSPAAPVAAAPVRPTHVDAARR